MKKNYGYKIGYLDRNQFIRKFITQTKTQAENVLRFYQKFDCKKYVIKLITKKENHAGIWHETPFI